MAVIDNGARRTTSSFVSRLRLALARWIFADDIRRAEIYAGDHFIGPLSSAQELQWGHRVVVHHC